jgi:hypothetical protein
LPAIARFYQAGARSPVLGSTDFAALICSCSHVAIQPITEMNWLCVIAPLASAAFAEARRIAANIAMLPELLRKRSSEAEEDWGR